MFSGTALAERVAWEIPQYSCEDPLMKKTALLAALSAASLVGGVVFAQTPSQPYGTTKTPAAGQSAMPQQTGADYSLTQLDKNKDGAVDKQEAKASPKLADVFDKADANKDGKLNAAELHSAASMTTK